MGAVIDPPVTVRIEDGFGNLVSSPATVTIALGTDPSAGTATLSGTLSAAAIDGVATFADLSLDEVGTGYTIAATATDLTSGTSDAFDIYAPPSLSVASIEVQTFSSGALLVTLSEAAGAGGQEVSLVSSSPTEVSVPTPVLIAEGTTAVEATAQSGNASATVIITASSDGFTDGTGAVTVVARTMS